MKTLEELKARFASIQDLPVSEEMIGAYIEGNLDLIHSQCVEGLMQQDDGFASLVNDCRSNDFLYDQSIYWNEPINFMGMEDISLPELPIEAINQYGNGEVLNLLDSYNSFEDVACASPSYDFIENNEFFSDDIDRFYIDDNSLDIETSLEEDELNDLDL
ncbi:MAG: hypothetical protein IKJ52_05530 [Muribaculaceae bacterium]|nr:hypothetical protein [Muribaculaceae bacterium]